MEQNFFQEMSKNIKNILFVLRISLGKNISVISGNYGLKQTPLTFKDRHKDSHLCMNANTSVLFCEICEQHIAVARQ